MSWSAKLIYFMKELMSAQCSYCIHEIKKSDWILKVMWQVLTEQTTLLQRTLVLLCWKFVYDIDSWSYLFCELFRRNEKERECVCVLIHAHIHRGKRDKINTTAAQAHHSLSLSLSLSSHTHPLALTDIMHDIRKYSQQENERKEGEKH